MKPNFAAFFKALLLLVAAQLLFSACSSDDEPASLVNYYLALNSTARWHPRRSAMPT